MNPVASKPKRKPNPAHNPNLKRQIDNLYRIMNEMASRIEHLERACGVPKQRAYPVTRPAL